MQNGVEADESQELEKGTDSNGATTSNFDNTVVTQAKIPANILESNAYKNIDHEMPKILLA